MTRTGKTWGCGLAGALLVLLLTAGGMLAQAPPPGAPAAEKPAEQVFKNIQVLKGLPSSQLIPTMQFMSGSLGVPCEHCHVEPRDSDAKKEKVTARKMIEMVNAINRDNFEGRMEVTCNSCHHGLPKPATVPAMMQAAWVEQMQSKPAAPAAPSADELFARYLKAVGGREAAAAVETRVYKGTATGYDGNEAPRPTPFEMYAAPGKLLAVQQGPNGAEFSYAYDGDTGWMKNPRGVRALAPREVETVRERAAVLEVIQLDDYLTTKVNGQESVNGRTAWVVEGTRKGASPVTLWFDAESGLLLRKRTLLATAFGPAPVETDFADYRAVGKVTLPFRVTSSTLSSALVREFSQIQVNVPVEDSKFTMPAAGK